MPRPTILYIGRPIVFAHEAWANFERKFNILWYDLNSKAEVIKAFSDGGMYSKIDGIIRPNLAPNMLPPLDAELVSHLPASCKIVSYCNHGYENENVKALEQKGVWYCNGAGAATESTADIGLFLILAVFRFTTLCELTLRESSSADWFLVEKVCTELAQEPRGKVLGVVGMGHIGAAVSQRAVAIGMTIHYFNRSRKEVLEKQIGGAIFHDNIDSLLKVSDCVLITCPYTQETHHLLNKRTLGLMKRGSRVVNIGRGRCVDEEALANALENGHLASAGLDVFHDEPYINPKLLQNRNVTLLPHIAGSTIDADRKFEEIAMRNIESFFFDEGKVLTPVNNIVLSCAEANL